MGVIDHSVATLRFFGDDLAPEALSSLLGASPTEARFKGEEIIGRATGKVRIAKTGSWLLSAERREPEDLEGQIFELLAKLTDDLSVWASLSRYEPDLFCGIFMGSGNDGLPLSAKALLVPRSCYWMHRSVSPPHRGGAGKLNTAMSENSVH